MNVVWLSWKDIRHPEAGGAEIVTHDLMRRMVKDGHAVTHVTAQYPGATERDEIDGIRIRRAGNRVTHYLHALRIMRELRAGTDLVVEEVNTVPYLASFLPRMPRVVLFYPQLAREIWFYQMPFPLSAAGWAAEPVYTWLQGRPANDVVTISDDSRDDLVRFGFRRDRIHVITLGIDNQPLASVDPAAKEPRFTVLFHSSLRPMKRPGEAIEAFRLLDKPDAQLWISGGGDQTALRARCDDRVTFFGRTSDEQKLDLMKRATVLCSTSVKEGWGLVVTEANSMGTPAIVYDIDGLRSASRAGGNWTVAPNPAALAARLRDLHEMFTQRRAEYDRFCREVHASTRRFTYDQAYRDFMAVIEKNHAL